MDECAGVCRGVILAIAPEASIIDITHAVTPFQISEGAVLLARAVPYLPKAVHLAVVDPGVGSSRRAIAIETADGSFLVGPDNGLLIPAAQKLGGVAASHLINNPKFMLPEPSATFHGRDIFAPAAAHLALGIRLEQLGPPLRPASLTKLDPPRLVRTGQTLTATVLLADHFGNLELNLGASDLAEIGIGPGDCAEVVIGDRREKARYVETFSSVRQGGFLLFEDSNNATCLAVNSGSAARQMAALPGVTVSIRTLGET